MFQLENGQTVTTTAAAGQVRIRVSGPATETSTVDLDLDEARTIRDRLCAPPNEDDWQVCKGLYATFADLPKCAEAFDLAIEDVERAAR